MTECIYITYVFPPKKSVNRRGKVIKLIIRFKVGNFLSFNETQELSMITGETRHHPDHIYKFENINILRTTAIYGANASGKSNLIKALGESRRMIISGKPIQANKYFRPYAANKCTPSYFEFEFENDGKYYSYGFEFILSKQTIESEWLYELKSEGDNKIFFQRIKNHITHEFKDEDKTRLDVYVADMENLNYTLFLTEMNRKKRTDKGELSIFSDAYNWFSQKMKVFSNEIDDISFIVDEKNKAKLLSALGTGITNICYEKAENAEEILPKQFLEDVREQLILRKNKNIESDTSIKIGRIGNLSLSAEDEIVFKKLVFKHGNIDISFDMEEESEGTQRLYNLLAMIVSKDEDSIYILDELDAKLHPLLTFKFIEMFLKEKAGTKNQLIFTTHESNLMDFKLLRRDEIWFVQKEKNESSVLYSLEDLNERTDRKIEKAYMEGRYGGIPLFSTIFPLECDIDEISRE